MTATLYLTNLASLRSQGHTGRGRDLLAMANPTKIFVDHSDGWVPDQSPNYNYLKAVQSGQVTYDEYFKTFSDRLKFMRRKGQLGHGEMRARSHGDRYYRIGVTDQDNIICGCARPGSNNRTHGCHLEVAAEHLALAGWRVIIYGRELLVKDDAVLYKDSTRPYIRPNPDGIGTPQRSMF